MGFHSQAEARTANMMASSALAIPRHVEIVMSEDDVRRLANLGREQYLVALGYFTAYLHHGDYTDVAIYCDGDDMVAGYRDSRSERRFTMGAVWRNAERKFTFHS